MEKVNIHLACLYLPDMGRPPKIRKVDFMEVVTALKGNSIVIGIQGENMARVVKFDLSGFSAYGPGTAMVVFQRPGDRNPYLVGTETEGNYLLWTITDTDTERAGHGWCELRYVNPSGLVIKSEIWRTYCGRSIQDMTDPLSKPYDSYLDQMSKLGALTTQNAAQTERDVVEANTTLERVENAGSQALSDIQTAGTTHLSNINTAGEAQVAAVSAEGAAKVEAVQTEGASQVEAVKSEGAAQVSNVTAAAEEITGKVAQIDANTEGLNQVKSDLEYQSDIVFNAIGKTMEYELKWIDNEYVETTGVITSYNGWRRTDYTDISGSKTIKISVGTTSNRFNCFYDKDKNFISYFSIQDGSVVNVPDNARYFILSSSSGTTYRATGNIVNTESVRKKLGITDYSYLSTCEHRGATISFVFDDGNENDFLIAEAFKEKGYVCGFALLSTIDDSTASSYLDLQEDGFEILSHSTDGATMRDEGDSSVDGKIKNSKITLENKGFKVMGWVTPSSQLNDEYLPTVKKYYDYGYTHYYDFHSETETAYISKNSDTCALHRMHLGTSDELLRQKVDECVRNNGFLTFYYHGHELDINFTIERLKDLLRYIKTYENNNDVKVLSPYEASSYFFHVRHRDLIELMN